LFLHFPFLLGVLFNGACSRFIIIYYFPIEPISLAVQISKLSHMLELWMLGLGEPGCIWYHDQNESPSFFVLGGGGGGVGEFLIAKVRRFFWVGAFSSRH
jgi:hypothetical protein